MKKITSRFTILISCFVAVLGLTGCGLRGYIPAPYHAAPAPVPAPVPPPVTAPSPPQAAPAAPNDGMVIPDVKRLPPAKKLPDAINENPLDGS